MNDESYMRHALRLAARGLGRVAPNPAVGCVIVAGDGAIAGRGWTQPGGRPHAETEALKQAGARAKGATAYVTLEPCAHLGQTPACAEALVKAGIARVVSALTDPDTRVSGKGHAMLEQAGISVVKGVCAEEARALNLGFLTRIAKSRPMVALKLAQSADGRVTDAAGESKWITGAQARAHGHLMRARYDAIAVGIGTAMEDDPELTCRLPGLETRTPLRVVLDARLRLPSDSKLARTAKDHPVLLFTAAKETKSFPQGVEIVSVAAEPSGRPALPSVLDALGARGVTRLLVEGGPTLHAALLGHDLVDIVHLYRAPMVLGGAGLPAVAALARGLKTAPRLKLIERTGLGPDVVETYAVES